MMDSPLEPFDVACGMVIGTDCHVPVLEPSTQTAREAMYSVVREALVKPPCLVSFSGGRDSSAILALAFHVARAEGLSPPIAATIRFPGDADADESSWQNDLLNELGASDRWQQEVTDELDLLGHTATAAMDLHELRYPPNVHFHVPLFAAAAGGSLISGVGGDELLEPHVWSRSELILGRRLRPRRADLVELATRAAAPRIRGRILVRELTPPAWLTPFGKRELRRRASAWQGEDFVRFDDHLRRWWWRSRYFRHGHASLELLAGDHNVSYFAPFMHPRALAALANDRGRFGFASRSAAMEALFGDLLPPAVIRRSTKAEFSQVLVGPATRAFAEMADPRGVVDEDLVSVEALHAAWREPSVDIRSLLALRACWLRQARDASGFEPLNHRRH